MTLDKFILFVISEFLIVLSTHAQREKRFFRKDYTYLDESSSFYKFHTVPKSWEEAKRVCELEGALFMYPEDHAEMEVVVKFWNKTQPHSHIWIGISAILAKGVYETVDGLPIADVYHAWSPGEPNDSNGEEDCAIMRRDGSYNDDGCWKKQSFMCKKPLLSLEWNKPCDMPDIEYQYNEEFGKCYKFHLTPKNWTEAVVTCHGEQSYLAVVNGEKEDELLVNITASSEKNRISGNYLRGAVWLGYHNRNLEGWRTVRGTSLADSGFSRWGGGQPDGGDKETCGSMFYNGGLNDLGCSHRCFFICEHDVGSVDFEIDERWKEDVESL